MEHYKRWVFGVPDGAGGFVGPYQTRGYACTNAGVYVTTAHPLLDVNDGLEGWTDMGLKKLRGTNQSYCNQVTDDEMWVYAGVANMLVANSNISGLISAPDVLQYKKLISIAANYMRSRFFYGKTKSFSGPYVTSINFDLGTHDTHADNMWSRFNSKLHPQLSRSHLYPAGQIEFLDENTIQGTGTNFQKSDLSRAIMVDYKNVYRISTINAATQVIDVQRQTETSRSKAIYAKGEWVMSPETIMTSWDLSHARRFVHVFDALYDAKAITGTDFPTLAEMQGIAAQFTYGTFNRDFKNPKFTEFISGTMGWYRVNYGSLCTTDADGCTKGYDPWDGSSAAITSGWGEWAKYNADTGYLYCKLDAMINSTDTDVRNHVIRYYEQQMWKKVSGNIVRASFLNYLDADNVGTKKTLLQFVPQLYNATAICP